MANTAVADPNAGLSQAQLAAKYGLSVAGARPSLPEYARRLWSYRYFIAAYANARVEVSFSNTRLGRLWQVLTPLTNAAIYFLIFGVVIGTNDTVPNFIPYLCTGLFIFNFTQAVALAGIQAITGNLGLIRALHFPRGCLPIAVTLTQFQNLLASIAVLMVIVLVTGEPLTVQWLLIVPALLLQSIFNVGAAMALARLGSKLTDLKQLIPFVMRTWMYASGVLYSTALFEEHLPAVVADIMRLNPLLIYIEMARDALVDSAPLALPSPQLWLLGVGWALLTGIGGFVYFWRGEQEYGRG